MLLSAPQPTPVSSRLNEKQPEKKSDETKSERENIQEPLGEKGSSETKTEGKNVKDSEEKRDSKKNLDELLGKELDAKEFVQ